MIRKLMHTQVHAGILLIRLVPGLVFLSEGIQKYLYPEVMGAGRFLKIGIQHPAFWAPVVGGFEIICGLLLLAGLLTRLAVLPLLTVMVVAFVTTKWPLLLQDGFWKMAHEYRTDFAMTILLIYFLIYGAGSCSLDAILLKKCNGT